MDGASLGTINSIAAFMQEGGAFMWVILFVWGFGLAIALERFALNLCLGLTSMGQVL
jgi:hypothetical protein